MTEQEFMVRPSDVRDAMTNVTMFANNGIYANVVMMTVDDKLTFMGSNGFVAIRDGATDIGKPIDPSVFKLDDFLGVVKFTKETKDLKTKPGWIKVSLSDNEASFKDQSSEHEIVVPRFHVDDMSVSSVIGMSRQVIHLMTYDYDSTNMASEPFAIHPMNLQKLGHLKPENKMFVVDMKFLPNPMKPSAQNICVIKYGPTCRVVIASIDRKRNAVTLEGIEPGLSKECLWNIEVSEEDLLPS